MNSEWQDNNRPHGGQVMRRSRGAVSGFVVLLLGAWGALIPFIGPYFDFSYTPDTAWTWTAARGWLQVLPGAVAIVAGVLLIGSRTRASAQFGAVLGSVAGAWYIIGVTLAPLLRLGEVGVPTATTDGFRALQELAFFGGLGALILFFSAMMLGRISVLRAQDDSTAHGREYPEAQAPPPARPRRRLFRRDRSAVAYPAEQQRQPDPGLLP